MKQQPDYSDNSELSPLKMGLAYSIAMLVGVLLIASMLGTVRLVFWLLCAAPTLVGMLVHLFGSTTTWKLLNHLFGALLCSLTFGISLLVAMVGSSNGNWLIPIILTLFLLMSAGYSGHLIARKRLNEQAKPSNEVTQESEYIQIAGRRIAWSTINHIVNRIAMFTPLLIAVGLNTGQMLSQQAVYWFFGGVSLFFSVIAAMGVGGGIRRVIVTTQGR